jgi:hypothetical protein
MAENLYRLSVYFENSHFEQIARKMVEKIIPSVDYPSAFSNWFSVLLLFSAFQKEVALCGESIENEQQQINQAYLPHVLLAGTKSESSLPFLKNRFKAKQQLFYVCQEKACLAPEQDFEKVMNDLLA